MTRRLQQTYSLLVPQHDDDAGQPPQAGQSPQETAASGLNVQATPTPNNTPNYTPSSSSYDSVLLARQQLSAHLQETSKSYSLLL